MSPAEQLKTNNIEIIRQLIANKNPVLVITLNQPYATLVNSYAKNGLDVSKICFIDAITTYALGKFPLDAKNCRFVNNPANMTDLGIAITEMLHRYPDKKPCIVFDSISTMLIYIPSITISKFIHYVTSKLKLLNSPGVFLAVEKSLDPLLMTQLVTFVDEVIDSGSFMIPSFMPAPHNAVTSAPQFSAPSTEREKTRDEYVRTAPWGDGGVNRNSWILSDRTGSCLYLYPDSFFFPSSFAIVGAGTGAISQTANGGPTPVGMPVKKPHEPVTAVRRALFPDCPVNLDREKDKNRF